MKFSSRKAALACGVAAAALMCETAAWAQQRSFDVPSGDAVRAIPEFARQAGIQIVAPADQLKGVQTPPVRGVLELHDALSKLLVGTGIMIASDDGQTIALANKKKIEATGAVRLAADVARPAAPSLAAPAAAIAAPPPEAVEEVLVTGSLIHGTAAIGIPVTSLGAGDFKQTGAVTLGDLLRTQPAVNVSPSASTVGTNGNSERQNRVDIHNFGTGHTLGLFDGMRFPGQADTGTVFDPSFIPQLAVDHIDVLAGGASATYGSDAEAGVINVILKRGYDGAISEGRIGKADGGGFNWRVGQLYGRTWDSGDITLTFESTAVRAIPASARKYLTVDFTPWGLANLIPIKSSLPGVVSTGAPSVTTGTDCTNCYSVPKGTGPTGLTWTALLANKGVTNEVNPFNFAELTPPQQSNSAVVTIDQNIIDGVQVFVEGFYANRRGQQTVPATIIPANTGTIFTFVVPTSNPFYPIGAPAGLRVSYSFGKELPPRSSFYEISRRYAGGFNLDLPYAWKGKIYASVNDENNDTVVTNLVNTNNASAALGNTVASTAANGGTPGISAFTKPANVPYLNVFCDPTQFVCNDPATFAYITGSARILGDHFVVHEYGANFDGPLFSLPAGPVRAAVGGNYVTYNYFIFRNNPFSAPAQSISVESDETDTRKTYAFFGQLNVPLIGGDVTFPMARKVELELSVRRDHYSDFGGTTNPKVALNWTVIDGLTLRGAIGTSFVAPSFAQLSAITSKTITPLNAVVGGSNTFATCNAVGGTPVADSSGATLNPTCTAALQFPGGILLKGGVGGLAGLVRPTGYVLGPETSHDESVGFDFTAEDEYLRGLTVDLTYWRSHITNLNVAIDDRTARLTDPNTSFVFLTAANTPNFSAVVNQLLSNTFASGFTGGSATNIAFILDGAARNAGSIEHDGLDYNVSYDRDMGAFGTWEAGIAGTYYLHFKTVAAPGAAPSDAESVSGAAVVLNGAVTTAGPQTQDVRMRYRARLGVNFDNWSVTGFVNYRAHFFTTEALPSLAVLTASGITNYSNLVPSYYTADLAISYNLGDLPANKYLQNISLQLVINDITNKAPPFAYKPSTSGAGAVAFWGLVDSPLQRQFSLTVTKTW